MNNLDDLLRQAAAAHRLTGIAESEYVRLRTESLNLRGSLPEHVILAHAKAAGAGLTGAEATAYVRRQIGIGYPDHYYTPAASAGEADTAPATSTARAGTEAPAAADVYARRAGRSTAEPATKLPDADSIYAARAAQAKRRAAGAH